MTCVIYELAVMVLMDMIIDTVKHLTQFKGLIKF